MAIKHVELTPIERIPEYVDDVQAIFNAGVAGELEATASERIDKNGDTVSVSAEMNVIRELRKVQAAAKYLGLSARRHGDITVMEDGTATVQFTVGERKPRKPYKRKTDAGAIVEPATDETNATEA